jgi:hypothetical protein
MNITLYLYNQNQEKQMQPLYCMYCGRYMNSVRGKLMIVANTIGAGTYEVPPGMPMFNLKCKQCKTEYSCLWQ